ncbi:hypothetical protein RJ639_022428 [Escallonia herrerae]|uniref:Protein kinase domain-containing protein n=1 Tax=Escallonia herrerae TaxID=1293975 RepID=A0AA89AFR9_9ASTE|nr:hypothetical protein RJ639_022428 [Escallonia herrerae]
MEPAEGSDKREERVALLVILLLASLSLSSSLLVFSYYCYLSNKVSKRFRPHKRVNYEDKECSSIANIQVATDKGLQEFAFKQLHSATGGFGKSNVIRHGGFGLVYRGVLQDGRKVAVKLMDRAGRQGEEEFDVELLSRLSSPYLLALVGYCSEINHKILVYEFMANGGLQEHLYPISGESVLVFVAIRYDVLVLGTDPSSSGLPGTLTGTGEVHSLLTLALGELGDQGNTQCIKASANCFWLLETRLRIALEAAKGLEYLHEHVSPPVIHGDFKSSNILLDKSFHAKVSDFGLAKLGSDKAGGNVSTRVYALTGHLTTKSDVYSYGVVLLELLTGRVPVDMKRPPGEGVLVSWALPQLTDRDKVIEIMDPALEGQYSTKEVIQVAVIAAMRVQPEADYRPLMADVVQSLVPLVKHVGEKLACLLSRLLTSAVM